MNTYAPCPKCLRLNRISTTSLQEGKAPVCGACQSPIPFSGTVVEAGGSALARLIEKSPIPVIVDFWAPWCAPCRFFAPTYQKLAGELSGSLVFAKLDTEAHPGAGDLYQIRSIPTLAIFKSGIEVTRQSGALQEPALRAFIQGALR